MTDRIPTALMVSYGRPEYSNYSSPCYTTWVTLSVWKRRHREPFVVGDQLSTNDIDNFLYDDRGSYSYSPFTWKEGLITRPESQTFEDELARQRGSCHFTCQCKADSIFSLRSDTLRQFANTLARIERRVDAYHEKYPYSPYDPRSRFAREIAAIAHAVHAKVWILRGPEESWGNPYEVLSAKDIEPQADTLLEQIVRKACVAAGIIEKSNIYWTTAISDYDGFGTERTGVTREAWGRKYEQVLIQPHHVEWQTTRYGSGNHACFSDSEFKKYTSQSA